MKTVLTYIIVALLTVSVCVVLFSLLGAVVFFLPLLGGAFANK